MKGIENLKLLVSSIAQLGSVGAKVFADGKVTAMDFPALIELYPVFQAVAVIKYPELLAEGADVSTPEMAELEAMFAAKLEFPEALASLEQKIEALVSFASKAVAWGKSGYELAQEGMALIKK